jgi:hypothetical protein
MLKIKKLFANHCNISIKLKSKVFIHLFRFDVVTATTPHLKMKANFVLGMILRAKTVPVEPVMVDLFNEFLYYPFML